MISILFLYAVLIYYIQWDALPWIVINEIVSWILGLLREDHKK